jgi:hypothetical protein
MYNNIYGKSRRKSKIMEESELVVLIRAKFCVCFILAENDENSINSLIVIVYQYWMMCGIECILLQSL